MHHSRQPAVDKQSKPLRSVDDQSTPVYFQQERTETGHARKHQNLDN